MTIHDLFISHASEDKDGLVRPLAEALRERGLSVWFDEYSLRLGDSLGREIDRGLASSNFGVVVLSPRFFAKEWPQKELDGLLARESVERTKRLLPVWHDISVAELTRFSPSLAGRVAIQSSRGLAAVVDAIVRAIEPRVTSEGRAPAQVLAAPSRSVNVPPGYELTLNLHRFRIAKDSASRSDKGGYEYPVSVRGIEVNVRRFVAEATKNGATSVASVTAGPLSSVSFDYAGPHPPEVFEAIATGVGVEVLQCGKPVIM